VIGFVVLLSGTAVYNQLLRLPCLTYAQKTVARLSIKDPSDPHMDQDIEVEIGEYDETSETRNLLVGQSSGRDLQLSRQRYYRALAIRFDQDSIRQRRISGEM